MTAADGDDVIVWTNGAEPAGPSWLDEVGTAVEAGGGTMVDDIDAATAVVWSAWVDPAELADLLGERPRISWIQLMTSGADTVARYLDDRVWTSAKGAYSQPIAEWALGATIAVLRGFPDYVTARRWERLPGRSLAGARVTILGGGGIAESLIGLLRPFDARVTVVRRQADRPVDGARVVGPDRLAEVAADTDVLVVALALTPETTGIVDAELINRLPDRCVIVNVARGEHVDTDALVDALVQGRLGGAALDVADPEPLPSDHPLWSLDRVLVTPHVSCPFEVARPLLLNRITDNVARRRAGRDLIGVVDRRRGY